MHNVTSPRADDQGVEQLIQAKGKTAPRVTPADIEANIVSEHYFTATDAVQSPSEEIVRIWHDDADYGTEKVPLDLLTFCVLVLQNGYTVVGHSACASPENFDAEIGRRIARENAVQQIWPLMGYALKERLER